MPRISSPRMFQWHQQPLTATSLIRSVSQLWEDGGPKSGAAKIGVCVSGGPDSMALAYLLKQVPQVLVPAWPKSNLSKTVHVEPFAFIVNHNARPESDKEAFLVQTQLSRYDIKSKILHMEWPGIDNPASLPDFEMKARHSRYQLIAQAAIQLRINHLFLGHHQDDQIETILMRLTRNSVVSFLALQGIPEHGAIPCCESIRGANSEDGYGRLQHWVRQSHPSLVKGPDPPLNINGARRVMPSLPGGLRLHRPLLSFSKSQLINFCNEKDIQYVEDKSNKDPTLTLRNAIRYLRANYTLPKALQRRSLLELKGWARNAMLSLVNRGTDALRMMKVLTFDLRSGLMHVAISKDFLTACESDKEAGANALARLTSVVSPQPKDNEPTLVSQGNLVAFLKTARSSDATQINIQQVILQKMIGKSDAGDEETIWSLARPPMRPSEIKQADMGFSPGVRLTDVKDTLTEASIRDVLSDVDQQTGLWSEWILWDHRYWIRVGTRDAESLSKIRIRAYQESDAERVYTQLKSGKLEFQAMLAEAAPGKLRYTIPVLTVDGRVSVFPTFNVMVQRSRSMNTLSKSTRHPVLEWEVCYKVIDQPFISEHRTQIEWRNAQRQRPARRRSMANGAARRS